MAVTVSAKNYTLINACQDYTQWTGETPANVTDFYKEGTQCVGFLVRGAGDNDTYITGSWNLSGIKHIRWWVMTVTLKELNYIQLYISDGANTGYYNVISGSDYPGGWYNAVVDLSRSVDSGTKPTMTSITTIGFRYNHTGTAKNAQNTWVDHIYLADGLIAYGDDAGGYFDMEDVYVLDSNTANGWGVITKYGGVYYVVGVMEIGDASGSNSCKFQGKNHVIIFPNRTYGAAQNINASLMGISVVDNGTGTTEFILGEKSGNVGINGCVVTVQAPTQASRFYIDARTDADVDNFKVYGSVISYATALSFPNDAANVEVISTNFIGCAKATVGTCDVLYCNFVSATSDAIAVSSTTLNVKFCQFINPTSNAIEITAVGTYEFYGLTFTGTGASGPYDVENTTAGLVTVQNKQGSGAQYGNNTGGGSIEFETTVVVSIHVEDEAGTDVAEAQVYINKTTPDVYTSDAVANVLGDTTFVVQEALVNDCPAEGWLWVYDYSNRTEQHHRYASITRSTKTFNLRTKVGPYACTNTGSETTQLKDTVNNFTSMDIEEGDTFRNETDGSWATVLKVVDADTINHTPLQGGTNNYWTNGDNYSFHTLALTYDGNDTAQTPILNDQTSSTGDVSANHNYKALRPIRIRIRKSSTGTTKYVPFETLGNLGTGGYSLDVILLWDEIAT